MNTPPPLRPLLLSIDDEAEMREIIIALAEDCGFRGDGADSPPSIRAALDLNPAAVVLDMIMPDMDGIEVIWEMARRKSQAGLIILTGFDPRVVAAAERLAQQSGLNLHATLSKPADMDELRRLFMAILTESTVSPA